ncbi:MAG: hypothetical protein CVU43_18265 [Chloroflexi bacterium HGW-Chloroflexi-5]|jgi:hypothetical protein|nr:MAG: hypothetical protein CVU43_18265 [Chloroflexi bacterium HGW-Chloroflexi-5]
MQNTIDLLAEHPEPSVRYRIAVGVRGSSEESREVAQLHLAVKESSRVQTMLAARGSDGKFPWHAYQKWNGSFWTFLVLADMGYPPGDESLIPLREQTLEWLLDPGRLKAIPLIDGRWRRCACQEGGAVFSLLRLGLADSRVEQLVQMLLKWQWPDGGWNCDKHPEASHSSFHESCIPLRALNAFWLASGDEKIKIARDSAAERFLSRFLYKNPATGIAIKPDFTKPAYPAYWHYDYLYGLRTMMECGLINDPRCKDALDLLESKRLPDGGYRAEVKYYQFSREVKTGHSFVDWGGTSKQRFNPFVTAEALGILKAASRI